MPASRSTPRRGRSSSVASNVSAASTTRSRSRAKAPNSAASNASVVSDATADGTLSRPPLPVRTNSVLPEVDLPVKVQVINRDGKNIIIGRVKLPTQNGADHAFLLKRFDTNAIVASSMFRIAFPWADKEEEDREMAYLTAKYDTSAANGGPRQLPSISSTPQKRGRGRPKRMSEDDKASLAAEQVGTLPEGSTGVRLQGTWIPCADALQLAKEYGLLRWAKPLIDAQAEHSESGPVLTPSKDDTVSAATPRSSKRARKLAETDANASGSPSVTRTRTTKKVHTDGTEETTTESTSTTLESGAALTPAQIEEQIASARRMAAEIRARNPGSSKASSSSERGSKRKAVKQKASAEVDPLSDEEDEEEEVPGNAVTRSLRQTARVARRRPIVTTAGTIGAAGAIGAGALAWLSGGNIDVATQLLQQGLANLGSFGSSWF